MTSYIEYAILREVNGGTPYIVNKYKTISEAVFILKHDFIEEHERKGKLYYVDNDFFYNPYANLRGNRNFYYYKIVSRKVTTWENYKYFEDEKNIYKTEEKSKILKFPNLA